MKAERRTEMLIHLFGWQGGTVHQACSEAGLDVHEFLYGDVEGEDELNSDFTRGWVAIRTCDREYFADKLKPANKGNLQFWFGACAGQNLIELGIG